MCYTFLTLYILHYSIFCFIFALGINNLIFNVIIMITESVLLRFANSCEWFDPYFVKANSHCIRFHALKKYSLYIVSTFSELDCTVSVRQSFDKNYNVYVIQ